MSTKAIFIIFLAMMILSGCSSRIIDFTIISSKNVMVKVAEGSAVKRVTGECYVTRIFGIRFGKPNLKTATDRAIESAGPGYDALIDGVIYKKYKWYFLFGRIGYKVQGTPIKTCTIQNK